jgi:hypothetical protein
MHDIHPQSLKMISSAQFFSMRNLLLVSDENLICRIIGSIIVNGGERLVCGAMAGE